jgi:DNA-binding NarL/FixJ family response regulator
MVLSERNSIAAELSLPLATVKHGVSSILATLHLQRRAQAAAFAAGHQLRGTE